MSLLVVLALLAVRQAPTLLGRWEGESHCVGARPSCHEEHVLYQVDSVAADSVTLDGSRIAGTDTVSMGALGCHYGHDHSEILCPIPSGIWRFAIVDGHLEGSLTHRDGSVMRRVRAERRSGAKSQD